ncbi:MAG: ATP phosphoribosyltransferase regulatory subunit [Deltaproteobacteria bacterium]|nr:ATP phosphoribosyltransferase regulatory subunit [Candidatus Zymogenaceae bacterium]
MDTQKRGKDLLPKDMIKFRYAERVFLEEAIRWGYQEIRTPTIEPISLFTAAGTLDPRMLDNIYSFLDWDGWSGQRVVLRPDGTIPANRLFIERFADAGAPVRLCYVADMFSYDEDGTSEHRQCGVELIEKNNGSPAASDAEVIGLSVSILRKMGFESPLVRVGYPPLVRELLDAAGLTDEEKEVVLNLIHEKNRDELVRVCAAKNLEKLLGLLELRSSSRDFIKNVGAFLPKTAGIEAALDAFDDSVGALGKAEIPIEISFSLPLNFEYYTGLVMEAYPDSTRISRGDVLMSGGRYDNLTAILSESRVTARAVGCALKIERIVAGAEFTTAMAERAVLVVPGTDRAFARWIVSMLRDGGTIAHIAAAGQDTAVFRWVLTADGDPMRLLDSSTGKIHDLTKEKIGDIPDLIGR